MSTTGRSRIPTLNYEHFTRGTTSERERFVRTMGEGLLEFGFFTLENHGIAPESIARAYEHAMALFALPTPVKQQYVLPGGGGQRGYTGFGKEHAKDRTIGDLKEFWHVGRELEGTHPLANVYAPNFWPTEIPTFKSTMLELYGALDHVADGLLRALAANFELAESTFADMARDGDSVLRVIHYPPVPSDCPPGAVRAAAHEDINLMTLLCEGTSNGLELLTRDGEWLPIDTLKGQIVVDSGDMLSRCTNGVVPSTTHRVVNPTGPNVPRYSMPFFVHPYPDCSLDAIDRFVTAENPRRHPAITADGFLKQRLREIGLIK